jgi:hypothetical protein
MSITMNMKLINIVIILWNLDFFQQDYLVE